MTTINLTWDSLWKVAHDLVQQPIFNTIQSTSSANTTASNTTSNAALAKQFPQPPENITSICNSVLFIIIYTILLCIIVSIYIKGRKILKRNHKILFSLVAIFILVQFFGLTFRLVYNSVSLYVNYIPNYNVVTNMQQMLVTILVFSVMENILVISQMATIVIIMSFIMIIL